MLKEHSVISGSRNKNEWKDYTLKDTVFTWHFLLSFYANEYSLGVAKTLEVLKRKNTLLPVNSFKVRSLQYSKW